MVERKEGRAAEQPLLYSQMKGGFAGPAQSVVRHRVEHLEAAEQRQPCGPAEDRALKVWQK